MIVAALDARYAVSFTTGLLAAVNPCGFVLLPTYLLYFLGMENLRPGGSERASIRRALLVSLAVSAGFLLVFAVIGAITKWSTDWFVVKAPWISLFIGVGLVVLGIAMLFGLRLPFTTPKLDIGQRDRTVRSMFVFGVAYAVASIGCTIPTFMSNVLGAVSAEGIGPGLLAFFWYSLGMALIVTGLTVTLAMANVAMLRVLRRSLSVFRVHRRDLRAAHRPVPHLVLVPRHHRGRARRPADQPGDVVAGVARHVHPAQTRPWSSRSPWR